MSFAWTEDFKAKARRLYVDDKRPPSHVSRCVGSGCAPADVIALAQAGGWDALRGSRAFHDGDQVERVRVLYVDQLKASGEVAEAMGAPWTIRQVRALVSRKGWAKARSDELKRRQKLDALEKGRAVLTAMAAARPKPVAKSAAPPALTLPDSRRLQPDVRAAIDAALAGGKVTVLPTRYAAGLTSAEQAFWAAGAGGGWAAGLRKGARR